MFAADLDLQVNVPLDGYELHWAMSAADKDPGWHFRVATPQDLFGFGFQTVRPDAEDPLLYRQFVTLNCLDSGQMLTFANRYGLPTHPLLAFAGEWIQNILVLRDAVRVHDLLDAGDAESLRGFCRWVPDTRDDRQTGSIRVSGHWEFRVPREPDRPPADSPYPLHADPTLRAAASTVADWEQVDTTSNASPSDDPRLVARAWLCQAVQQKLESLGSLQFAPDPKTGQCMFRLAPRDLIPLLWLQFVRAISSGTRQQRCRECGKWFELLPKHRGRKEFCTTACKLREFRRRQHRAVELKAAGRTVKQIATELDTDINTVKRWVGGKANRKEK